MNDRVVSPGVDFNQVDSVCTGASCIVSAELQSLATYWLRRLARRLAEAHCRTTPQLHVKPYEFAALSLIARNPGITSAQLSAALGMRRPNFVHVLRDLEASGLVKRCAHAGDGRARGLVATESGAEKIGRLAPLIHQVEAEALSALTVKESKSLLALLRKAAS
ncbi:MarR family winged helix-turn-helix transcriptional regulator [Acidovorax sp. Leaf84]|uniref:MarR family winged helix-turn-helix transcriptional regulator n=1 Tax=Acidovorax sp. Leaf84 TaxID=1736240 RepID=UPI003FA4C4E2